MFGSGNVRPLFGNNYVLNYYSSKSNTNAPKAWCALP